MLQLAKNESEGIDVKAIVAPPAEVTDEDIIKRITAGDINAYGSIMRRYNQRLFRIARSIVSDDSAAMDSVQEAHIKAYTHLQEYQGPGTFFTWLARITRNESLMYLRKHKKEVLMQEDDIQALTEADIHGKANNIISLPDSSLENKQLQKLINSHIDKLPADFRTVFVLRAIEQFNVKETAEILGINKITVKTRYFRAKRLLRGQLQAYLDTTGMNLYEVGGIHCDMIVYNVLSRIKQAAKED